MKVLITGSNGQLGKALNKNKLEFHRYHELEIYNSVKSDLDLSDELSCIKAIEKYNPDWVINCGAFTAVDKAEIEFKHAYKVNGYGPYFLAKKLKQTGGKLLHISTDFVFDGKSNKAYKVNDPINPINTYGKTKALGEKFLTAKEHNFKNIFIIRASWIIDNRGENFFLKILKLLSKNENLKVVNDQIGCLTNVNNLSKLCWKLISIQHKISNIPSIIHFCDSGICTWYDVACAIGDLAFEKKIISKKPKIIPVESNYFNLPAKRPNFSLLNCEQTYDFFKYHPPHWRETISTLLDSSSKDFMKNL